MKPDDYQKQCMIFLSTPSVWRATPPRVKWKIWLLFLSTPSVWRATPLCRLRFLSPRDFYPRSPCGGRRSSWRCRFNALLFLSTPSVWRATVKGGRCKTARIISIHALRVEGDKGACSRPAVGDNFYPRPPCGGRQKVVAFPSFRQCISIHALRVEGDNHCHTSGIDSSNFYPRPPCGGRRSEPTVKVVKVDEFLSTPSVWRATDSLNSPIPQALISIHALRVEGDRSQELPSRESAHISIHALRVEGDYPQQRLG